MVDITKATVNLSLAGIWAIMVAIWPVGQYIDSRYAHSEDYDELSYKIDQINLNIMKSMNAAEIKRLMVKLQQGIELRPHEKENLESLKQQRLMIQQQQLELYKRTLKDE
jgi:hypothetical protein